MNHPQPKQSARSQDALPKTPFQRFGYHAIRWICYFFFLIAFRLKLVGLEKIPKSGPVLITPNHQSHLDPMLIGCVSRRRMNFLAKKQLFRVWPIGWIISFLDSIPIDREGMSAGGIKETLKRMKRGEMVLMFPEGTRSPDGEMKKILPGFCALVKRTQATIVPTGIQGADRAWPRRRAFPLPGPKIVIVFGDPVTPDQYQHLNDDQLVEFLDHAIRHEIEVCRRIRSGKAHPNRVGDVAVSPDGVRQNQEQSEQR